MKLAELKPNPDNPRIIKDDKFKKLVQSIKDFPKMMALRPMVVDDTGTVLGGNMRLKALQELKFTDIPDEWVKKASDLTPEEIKRFIVVDNIGFGEHDWDALANGWDMEELQEWGLDIPDFVLNKEAIEDDYVVPDEIETDIVLGDLFEIGQHRLLCGDSTNADDVAKLMNGQKADITFTSPPYNAGKTATELKTGKESKYLNDSDTKSKSEYLALLTDSTKNSLLFSVYSFVNVQSIAGNKTVLIDYLYQLKDVYADTLIWQKQTAQPAMAKNVLNSQFEYIHCFSQKANRAIGVKSFRGTISNVIEIAKQSQNEFKSHSATFPVAFPFYFIENFTIQSVLDLFIGSGTTMVAGHQLNRKVYAMEIEPKYCQCTIDRMLKLDNSLVIKKNGITVGKQLENA